MPLLMLKTHFFSQFGTRLAKENRSYALPAKDRPGELVNDDKSGSWFLVTIRSLPIPTKGGTSDGRCSSCMASSSSLCWILQALSADQTWALRVTRRLPRLSGLPFRRPCSRGGDRGGTGASEDSSPGHDRHNGRAFSPGQIRDIDILFVGNLNPAVQRQRLPWLMRLARLGKRWRVAIHAGIFGDSYRKLLARARIVFNHVSQPRCSRRVFEAVAAGALLFEDAANGETAATFRDRQECVLYNAENLEALLEYYLSHESER